MLIEPGETAQLLYSLQPREQRAAVQSARLRLLQARASALSPKKSESLRRLGKSCYFMLCHGSHGFLKDS